MAISVAAGFWLVLSVVIVLGYVFVQHATIMPVFARNLYLFGKVREGSKSSSQTFDVPKSWFTHFYIVGTMANALVLIVFICSQLLSVPVPSAISAAAWTLVYPYQPKGDVLGWSILLTLLLYQVQVGRRLQECLRVSIFSRSFMGVQHYGAGLALYSSFSLSAAAPALVHFHGSSMRWTASVPEVMRMLVGIAIFAWASVRQHESLTILANLRKNSKGTVVGLDHRVPQGGLFAEVSCPQYLCEVLIYAGISLVLGWGQVTCLAVTWFVLSNQMAAALITHAWYRRTFPGYPSSRKAIFPRLL